VDYYRTSQVAEIIGVHPNTVRLYEKNGLIPYAHRESNGYRLFTDFHLDQFRLARTALEVEILQNGLRKCAVSIIKASAKKDFDEALALARRYVTQIREENTNANEALAIVKKLLESDNKDLDNDTDDYNVLLSRKEAAAALDVTVDTLRNWERNGLLTVEKNLMGYPIYTSNTIRRLKIIRTLRLANYSLTAILRMLNILDRNVQFDIEAVIDTPGKNEDIVSVCDKLLSTLNVAENNMTKLIKLLEVFKQKYK
jgi:DNA-binding transcriptional MerR regulator